MFRFVIMPLYMFSGTFFAITQLPEWIRSLAYVLPLCHGVELCRALALGTATPAAPPSTSDTCSCSRSSAS